MSKKSLIFGALIGAILLSGCASNSTQLQPKKVIYTPSEDLKKAVAILIYKQKELENRVSRLENGTVLIKKTKKNSKCIFKKSDKKEYCDAKFAKNGYYQAISDVNIRRCATIHSPVVGMVKKGEKVQFLHCNKYCWCFLKDNRGYVNRKFFKLLNNNKHNNQNNINNLSDVKEKNLKRNNVKVVKNKIKEDKNINQNKKSNTKTKKVINADEVIKNYINSK
jgi:uncharacterized protein YgiM (DUF1202 family)